MIAARAAVGCALLVAVAMGAAHAAADSTLALVVEHCPSLDEEQLRTLVGLELATVAAEARDAYRIRLACVGERVTIELRRRALDASPEASPDGAGAASQAPLAGAEVDLGGAAEGTRARILALAITEQLGLEVRARAQAAAVAAPASLHSSPTLARVTPQAPVSPARWRLAARASARTAARPSIWLVGAGVGVERALTRFVGVAIDLVAESGEADVPIATVTMHDLMATAGLSLGAQTGRWSWGATSGFTLGFAHLAATPREAMAVGATLDGVWAGPSLGARGRCALSRHVFVVADASVGLTTRRVSGLVDGQTALFELRGPWLSLGAGVGAAF